MKNIAKAIIEVMKAVKGMEKNSTVGSGRSAYNGTKDQDVKEVFNEALANNGLCILPIKATQKVEITKWDSTDYNGKPTVKQSVFTQVETKYLLLHESGESIELAGAGHGVDPQDKGAGKALTYALKNTLLYTFLTPVGKIDDTETTHSNEITTPQKAPVTINFALTDVVNAVNVDALTGFWNAHSHLQNNEAFVNAVKDRKKQLIDGSK